MALNFLIGLTCTINHFCSNDINVFFLWYFQVNGVNVSDPHSQVNKIWNHILPRKNANLKNKILAPKRPQIALRMVPLNLYFWKVFRNLRVPFSAHFEDVSGPIFCFWNWHFFEAKYDFRFYLLDSVFLRRYHNRAFCHSSIHWNRIKSFIKNRNVIKNFKLGRLFSIFISTKSGVILFELFSLFSSHMDRAVCIGNAKEFRFHSELEIYKGNYRLL